MGMLGRTRCGVAKVKEHSMSRDRLMDENVARCVMSNKALTASPSKHRCEG